MESKSDRLRRSRLPYCMSRARLCHLGQRRRASNEVGPGVHRRCRSSRVHGGCHRGVSGCIDRCCVGRDGGCSYD